MEEVIGATQFYALRTFQSMCLASVRMLAAPQERVRLQWPRKVRLFVIASVTSSCLSATRLLFFCQLTLVLDTQEFEVRQAKKWRQTILGTLVQGLDTSQRAGAFLSFFSPLFFFPPLFLSVELPHRPDSMMWWGLLLSLLLLLFFFLLQNPCLPALCSLRWCRT